MIKLIGIVLILLGFSLRLNTLLVVLAAGIATGLTAGPGIRPSGTFPGLTCGDSARLPLGGRRLWGVGLAVQTHESTPSASCNPAS